MNKILVSVICLLPYTYVHVYAAAQTQTQTLQDPPDVYTAPATPTSRDPPPGFPYNTGLSGNADLPSIVSAQVPLRDFLSSRQDLQYAELSKQISSLSATMQQVIDERDRQYAQRFAAQQTATEAALAAARELSNQALGSAKEAVAKAESAADRRFESVNEFRAQLADQANQFMNVSTADARFKSLEEKVDDVVTRINIIQAQREGGAETWGWIALVGGFIVGLFGLLYGMNRDRRATVVKGD